MISVDEAFSLIVKTSRPLAATEVPLTDALGMVLAETMCGTLDVPPFDKAMMDGYAIRTADFVAGCREFRVIEEITAGKVPQFSVQVGEAARIMTGATVPSGADAVVMVEQTQQSAAQTTAATVVVTASEVSPEQNLLRRGVVARQGGIVVPAGTRLRPQEIAALAESGYASVRVAPRPKVAILATGDEIVPVGNPLAPGQIWNSNEPMLVGQVQAMGALPSPLGIAQDDPDSLRPLIQRGLACDMLLLTGGVSAGKKDLVPQLLAEAGVRQVFHKIQMKPGKPLWFGVFERTSEPGGNCLVFGLPGNPVSSMVCAELFVRTAFRRLVGYASPLPESRTARLARAYRIQGSRLTYHPANLFFQGTDLKVELVDWVGSSDLHGTVNSNGLVMLPPGDHHYAEGEMVPVISWQDLPAVVSSSQT